MPARLISISRIQDSRPLAPSCFFNLQDFLDIVYRSLFCLTLHAECAHLIVPGWFGNWRTGLHANCDESTASPCRCTPANSFAQAPSRENVHDHPGTCCRVSRSRHRVRHSSRKPRAAITTARASNASSSAARHYEVASRWTGFRHRQAEGYRGDGLRRRDASTPQKVGALAEDDHRHGPKRRFVEVQGVRSVSPHDQRRHRTLPVPLRGALCSTRFAGLQGDTNDRRGVADDDVLQRATRHPSLPNLVRGRGRTP